MTDIMPKLYCANHLIKHILYDPLFFFGGGLSWGEFSFNQSPS